MPDENEISASEKAAEISDVVGDIAADIVEEEIERREISEEVSKAVVESAMEQEREQRVLALEERIASWQNKFEEMQASSQMSQSQLAEMMTMQRSMAETIARMSEAQQELSTQPASPPPPTEEASVVEEVAPVNPETIAEVPAEPESPPPSEQLRKRRLRLL